MRVPELSIHTSSLRELCAYFFMSVFPSKISGRALFVLTRVAMIYPEKPDVLIRVRRLPRDVIRIFGKTMRRSYANARLFSMSRSNTCFTGVTTISQTELMQRIEAGHTHLILDVRNPEEYKRGHIPSAINIPHNRLDSRFVEIVSHSNRDVVLYCGSGVRVGIAANILQSAGFSKLLHLEGDMNNWLRNDMPVAK